MRKQDIIITTPKKSMIYAIGTRPETNHRVWQNPDNVFSLGTQYAPGYVLAITEGGYARVLAAGEHPDSPYAKRNEQASALDALDYKLKDYDERQAVLEKFSHWPLSEEQRIMRQEALDDLKPLPKGWSVQTIRTANVRMLWAEYDARLKAIIAEAKLKAEEKKAAEEQARQRRITVRDRLVEAGLIEAKRFDDLNWRGHSFEEINLPIELIESWMEGVK